MDFHVLTLFPDMVRQGLINIIAWMITLMGAEPEW